jgi:hypothetical protein
VQIERALQKLEAAERKHENEPSEDTRSELAFQRKSLIDLRREIEQLREREIEILRLQKSPDPGTSSHKTNFLF